jgi:hypothetical protein
MNRPVKIHLESMQALPFIFSLYPRAKKFDFVMPYMIPIVNSKDIEGIDVDIYLPTGKKRVAAKEEGYIYLYDRHMKQVKNQVDLHSYQYRYKYTICNT